MKRYKIQSKDDWNNLKVNDQLTFKVVGNYRTLHVEFNSSHHVSVFGSYSKDMKDEKLLVSDRGLFALVTTVSKTMYLRVVSDTKSVSIVYKNRAADHLVRKMSDEKFTGIEMRRTRNPEMERLLYMVQHAQSQREEALLAEIGRRDQVLEEQNEVVEEDEPAVSKVVSDAGSAPETSGTASEAVVSRETIDPETVDGVS